jgi:biotin transport system substrate-specific component
MRNPNLRNLILAAMFTALTAVIAQVKLFLPGVTNVPVTLQVLAVCLTGSLLGPLWGAAAMAVYVLLGAVGVPVYAGGAAGLQVLLGLTGGYLFSYPVAALVIGLVAPAHKAPSVVRTAFAMVLGLAVIYAGGGGWAVLVGGKALGAVLTGWVLPFVPLDLVKVVLATAVAQPVNRALAARGYWYGRTA